ncbi:hypothetical protein ACUUL3_01890 [Thiovibrio sp. JS02]
MSSAIPTSRAPYKPFALFVLCALALYLSGCKGQEAPRKTEGSPAPATQPARQPGCQGCHAAVRPDPAHDLGCGRCHGGDDRASDQEQAHAGLVARPAHPERMRQNCGACHAEEVREVAASSHFTLKNEVNLVRAAFGAGEELADLSQIPVHETITTPLALADDLLRRRCLRCHVYSPGDSYPETVRGTGCAACHLLQEGGGQKSHAFVKSPPDSQCLHCHYGNQVGADYWGRFEHDFGVEYRTPYHSDGSNPRPYGVEFHQLAPDIHQQAGMACIDCHSGAELMGRPHAKNGGPEEPLTCLRCHGWRPGLSPAQDNLEVEEGRLVLRTRLTGRKLVVPVPANAAHQTYGGQADCAVCHSQWTFNDQGTHLIRYDLQDYDPWAGLSVQGSFEVEDQLDLSSYEAPFLRDKLTDIPSPGIWFKGFELRRWELPLIGHDAGGRLRVFRPILDLHLSLVNKEGEVLFDAVAPRESGRRYLPYTPHTIGKAGAFYRERLQVTLPPEARK